MNADIQNLLSECKDRLFLNTGEDDDGPFDLDLFFEIMVAAGPDDEDIVANAVEGLVDLAALEVGGEVTFDMGEPIRRVR